MSHPIKKAKQIIKSKNQPIRDEKQDPATCITEHCYMNSKYLPHAAQEQFTTKSYLAEKFMNKLQLHIIVIGPLAVGRDLAAWPRNALQRKSIKMVILLPHKGMLKCGTEATTFGAPLIQKCWQMSPSSTEQGPLATAQKAISNFLLPTSVNKVIGNHNRHGSKTTWIYFCNYLGVILSQ